MRLSEARAAGLFKVRIPVGEFFGVKPDELTITMREPSIGEAQEYLSGKSDDSLEGAKKLFPRCIVASDFDDESGGPAKAEEVASLISQSAVAFGYVLKTWQEALPLEKRRAGSSGN